MTLNVVLAYHARSKHSLNRYARGPDTLDWDAQPKAFRDWAGTQQIALPREVVVSDITWCELPCARPPLPLNMVNIASMLRLCAGITAWKEYAGSRWSLRAHPSSGNLHPTETWLIASGAGGLEDGLYHFFSLSHTLERRAWGNPAGGQGLWLGFSSIHWREAWKYGERAFRYCQLDLGHVLAAVCYASVLHGWRPRLLNLSTAGVARSLGLDRETDFAGVEAEEAEVIVSLEANGDLPEDWLHWAGKPALLDPHPLYQWTVIEEVAEATRGAAPPADLHVDSIALPCVRRHEGDILAARVILKRRSAQGFDGESELPGALFKQILASLLPGGSPVWDFWPHAARVHPVLMVHRVEGVPSGLYVMPRSESAGVSLRAAFRDTFTWQAVEQHLFQLVCARAGKIARTLSCHQQIASQCAVTFMMVAEFAQPVARNSAAYRHLHWEAGMLGHVITLEAEAAGWRGTGIGCFFDDAVHEVLGLKDDQFQVIYHYAIGMAVNDPRITTLPAYN